MIPENWTAGLIDVSKADEGYLMMMTMTDRRKEKMPQWRQLALATAVVALVSCSGPSNSPTVDSEEHADSQIERVRSGDEIGAPGGRLVVSLTSDPRTFNPLLAVSASSLKVLDFVHEDLLSFDPMGQTVGYSLAESWTLLENVEPKGTSYRLRLRPDLRFSDGEPFDADDVIFTVRAALDPKIDSPQRETLLVDGLPIRLKRIDRLTLDVELPKPVAEAGLLFDRLYMLPQHLMEETYQTGGLPTAWGTETPVDQIVGLGPFRLSEYLPGERMIFERNPHFWGRDAEGQTLPYLEELVVLIVPDRQAEILRFEAGEVDIAENIPAEGFERSVLNEKLDLLDLGAGTTYEFLFFNLNQVTSMELSSKQKWFRELAFRQALSRAVDRQGIVDLVYGGRATPIVTHVSPGNRRWWAGLEPQSASQSDARALLSSAGFTWTDAGRLQDAEGIDVALTVLTNSSSARRVKTGTILQEDLKGLGIDVQIVPMEFGALLDRVTNTYDYEIGLLGLGRGGIDPNSDLNVWHSSGSNHLWHLGVDCPTSEWEARIDELMDQQKSELDPLKRKRLYEEVQSLVAEHLPVVPLVAPNVLAGADGRLGNFAPTIFEPPILWNVERLFWRSSRN